MSINVGPRISTHRHSPNTNLIAFDYKAWRNGPGIHFSCVKYNFLVPWPCHWRWSPDKCSTHENSTVRRGGQSGMFCFRSRGEGQGYKNELLVPHQWWQITSRPLDEKTFQGTLRWDEVAAITTSHILKINTCFHTSSLPEVNSFPQAGHPVADPYFWNVGGQETLVAPRGAWGTVLLI